jgi:hypothetical protein
MAANPFAEFAAKPAATVNPFAEFAAPPVQSEIPGARREPGFLTQLGRSAASLADVTVGGILPAVAQQVAYPLARIGRSPEQAQAATARVVGTVEQPFGKFFGVSDTPEYQQEVGRQLLDFVGQNFQKGAKWIAGKTGLPQSDVENILGTLTVAAPKIVPPVARAIRDVTAPAIEKATIAAKMPFEKQIQARNERLSLEDYARGPQIDAVADARRLKLLLNPVDIENTAGTRLTSAIAGDKGVEAVISANKNQVRSIALNELDLPSITQLNGSTAFKESRAKVAGPYEEVKKLPVQQADDAMIQRLENLRADLDVIGAKEYAPAISKIVDDAISKTQTGLTGEQLLKNVSVLRERARKTYNNKAATTEALDIADTNLKVATELESMMDSSISNPKLLDEYRAARQQMARSYAYEGATDFNTGIIDVKKLARITEKDNAMTGDIAALGRVAGNFPEVFTTKAATPLSKALAVGRSGAAGTLGGVAGYALGQDYVSAAAGTVLGALGGKVGQSVAANRMASPGYQAGLNLRDMRIPVNQLAASMQPQTAAVTASAAEITQQLNLTQTKIAQLEGALRRTGDATERQFITAQINRMQQYTDQLQQNLQGAATEPQNFLVVPPAAPLPAMPRLGYDPNVPVQGQPGAFDIMRARERDLSMRQGAQAEAQQAAAEAATRRPTSGAVELQINPLTGLPEIAKGIKGATPAIIEGANKAAVTAAEKMRLGRAFDMTAVEKVQWGKSLLEGMPIAQGEIIFGKLTPQQITGKMQDRAWVDSAITKARQEAQAFDQIATRAADARAKSSAIANRERMLDLAEQLQDALGARPVQRSGQGPKTRAFQRNMLRPDDTEIQNALAK